MSRLSDLKGLGLKTEYLLQSVGVMTCEDLKELGAVKAFLRLKQQSNSRPSLNLLYALVGAVENTHWIDIARTDKSRLLMELEGYRELELVLVAEGLCLEF
jgi:DNA transformation protein